MLRKSKAIFLAAGTLLLCGCGPSALPPGKYVAWLTDAGHGFRKVSEFGPMTLDAQYMPPAMVALVEGNCGHSRGLCDSLKAGNDKSYSFQYRIKGKGMDDVFYAPPSELYGQRVSHASFDMQQDFTLIAGSDTLKPALYLVERNFGVSPYTVFLLKFERPEKKERNDLVLVYNDQLFGLDKVVSRFAFNDLDKEPTINWKE